MIEIYTFENDESYYGMSAIEQFNKWQNENSIYEKEDIISVTVLDGKITVAVWE